MEMFAIRHNPTGRLLPAPRGRGGRGGTHVEFGDPGMPRLFDKPEHARAALRYWLEGKITVGQTISGAPWDEDTDEEWRTEPTPHRVPEDCSVVSVTLTIGERK